MPVLAAPLDLSKFEARNLRAHILGTAPSSPVTGQMYYNSGDNTLYWWDGTIWQSAKGGAPGGAAGGDLAGTYPNPSIAPGVIVDADINAGAAISKSKLAALNIADADVAAGAAIAKSKLATLNIVNADVAAGAAIAYAKLALTAAIVNADIAGAAAIAYSKLNLATSIVNGDISAAAAIAYSKLTLTNSIVNADIAAGAAIGWTKIASALAITNADINAAAGIVYSKLNLTGAIINADIAAGAAIALTKLATDPLARANHTGTQLANTISNFDTQVRTSTLNQMAAPTAAVAMNAQKISGLADGTAGTDAVTKQQLDAVATGLDVKASVRVASTANVTVATPGTAIDGVTLTNGDRVLLKNQTTGSENGIYIFNGSASAMTRATDADSSAEVNAGLFTFVEEGTANQDSGWVLTTNNPITLNTTALVFAQFSGAGQIVDGAGLVKTGNTLDVNPDNSTVEVVSDQVRVKDLGITNAKLAGSIDATTKLTGAVPVANGGTGQTAQKAARETGLGAAGYYSSATHGAGTSIVITQATHGLRASRGLIVQAQTDVDGAVVLPDVAVAANGDVTLTFGASQSANSIRVTIIG
jgi:hypothetical protein